MVGQKLNNRYTITTLLGEGGMGEVFLASDEQTGQQVAVKILARQLITHPELIERFRREAETLRKLDHPNIVKFVDAFEHEGQYVIVMECLAGGSLHDLIKKGPLPIEQARQIVLDLCDALIRTHRLNIIHRDLKPENVLLAEDGTPKLADFGVARLNEGTRMTRSGTQVGTPYYMSPEAWEGKTLDAQADIWSLGIVFFEMLTGQVPFGGDTGASVMNKVLTTQPPDLNKLRSEVPLALTQIIKRMLTRDKKQRYSTMRQLAAELEQDQLATASLFAEAKSTRRLPVLIGLGLILAISAAWLLTQYQGAQSTLQVAGLTNTPPSLSTATREPSMTPVPSNTSTSTAVPLIANLGQVVLNESFEDLDFPFTFPGVGRIESSVLLLESPGNGLYASFLVEPDVTTIILFKTTPGTQFNIGYHTGGYGTETLRRFSYESSISRWELYEGNVDANGGNIPINRWQASPLQFNNWHYFLLTRSANGDIDAKIFERDNPQNMIELHENLGSEWGQLPLSSFIDFRLGSMLVDEYQDIQPLGALDGQITPTLAGEATGATPSPTVETSALVVKLRIR